MALEQQINGAVEAGTAQLAGQFRERLESLAEELSQAASAAHARALEEAAARVRTDLALQQEEAVEALRAELASQQEAALEALRPDLAAQHEAAMAALAIGR